MSIRTFPLNGRIALAAISLMLLATTLGVACASQPAASPTVAPAPTKPVATSAPATPAAARPTPVAANAAASPAAAAKAAEFAWPLTKTEVKVEGQQRTITFYDGEKVTVPMKINRVASGWNAQNSIIAMLGYGDKIVATTEIIKSSPVFARFVPSITNAVMSFTASGDLNVEEVLAAEPDVAFIMTGSNGEQFRQLQDLGVQVAFLKSNSLKNLVDRTMITGRILGDDAYQQALKYKEYFESNVARVSKVVAQIPPDKRVRVYHSVGNALATSNAPSLNNDWMELAGVINVARDWKLTPSQTASNTTVEQVIAANPDVIVAMKAADAQTIRKDPAWASIKAVADGKVIVNPQGMFWWSRETTEQALQVLWLAKTVYPTYFADVDMAKETKSFYKDFYGYDLTDADVQAFLNPK